MLTQSLNLILNFETHYYYLFRTVNAKTLKERYIRRVCQLSGAKFVNEHTDVNAAKTFCIRKEIKLYGRPNETRFFSTRTDTLMSDATNNLIFRFARGDYHLMITCEQLHLLIVA